MDPATSAPDRADFYAAAIYGSLLAASLITVLREQHDSPETTLLALLATMAVFWLAHVWSEVVAERVHRGERFTRHQALHIARAEWPLVESALLPAVVLLLGWAGVLPGTRAEDLALVACVLQLAGWGLAAGHRAYDEWWKAIVLGLGEGLLGVGLVWLEVTVTH